MKETLEDMMRRRAKIEDYGNKEHSTHAQVTIRYFPFTEKCPLNGNLCSKEYCEEKYYKNDKCLHNEIDRVMYEVFQNDGESHIYFDGKKNDIKWILNVQFYNRYITDGKIKNEIGISISPSLESHYKLDRKVIVELGMVKKFNVVDTTKYYAASFRNLSKLREYLEYIRDNEKAITKKFNEVYTCVRCGNNDTFVGVYRREVVCRDCKTKIIEQWVRNRQKVTKKNPKRKGD